MDDGRVSYEEAAEAIRKWGNMVHDFSDNDAEIIYANGRPIDMVREQIRNTLTTYDLEHARVALSTTLARTKLFLRWKVLCPSRITATANWYVP